MKYQNILNSQNSRLIVVTATVFEESEYIFKKAIKLMHLDK